MKKRSRHRGGASRGTPGRATRLVLDRVKFRRARPSDKAAVLGFCRRTWGDYGDFIHRVWDEWVRDKSGFYAVAALGARPIGTAKITLLNPGEVWFEGLRVDREFRGIGLAQALTDFLLKKAARMGARSVRYATGGSNLTSQHIGKSWGFNLLRRYTCLEAFPDGRRAPAPVRVTDPAKVLTLSGVASPGRRLSRASAVTELTRVLKSSRFVTLMKGLASEGWTFYQIDERFVKQALARRDFYVVPAERSGSPRAPSAAGILVASAQRRRGRLLVWTLADLREDCFPLLPGAARRLAYELGLSEVRLVLSYARVITMPVRAAGFHQEYEGMSCVVMERGRGRGSAAQRGRAGRGKPRRKSPQRSRQRTKSGNTR